MQKGFWKSDNWFNEGLFGKNVGLVGFGMVAKYLVGMLAPYRVRIKVYDPFVQDKVLSDFCVERASLEDIFSTCRVISLHAPKTPGTYHMINKELLRMIPDGALFVNTARGAVVDEEALVQELQTGRFKAVLDVYEIEPLPLESKLRGLQNVLLIPHMAGPTIDLRKTVTEELASDIKSFFSGKQLKYEIDRKYAAGNTIILVIAIVFLITMGSMEIMKRRGVLKKNSQSQSIKYSYDMNSKRCC
jgi:phosphoglycerate dehydrogenase-like enzyme